MPALPTVVFLLAAAVPAQDPGLVARYKLDGEPAVVTFDELALEMARRQRRTDDGRAALEHLINLELVRQAAREQGVEPSDAEVRAWIPQLAERLRSDGLDLDAKLRSMGMSRAEFEEYARTQLAHIKLVRKALELPPGADVDGDMLGLWLAQERRKRKVVTDESELPRDSVAEVGGRRLGLLDLGRLLTRSAKTEDRAQFVTRIVRQRCVEAAAAAQGITVTAADIEQEIEARRKLAEANPRLHGLSFEKFLESIGTTIDELRTAPVLRAQILERKLIDRLYPTAELDRRLREDRAAIEQRHGERRRLDVLLVAAGAQRSAEQADREARRLLQAIEHGKPFREAALDSSDDPYTRIAGGDAGWHHRQGSSLPEPVVAAGFDAELQQTVGPVRVAAGCYLVRPTAIEPTPEDAVLRSRLRDALHDEHISALLARAQVEMLR